MSRSAPITIVDYDKTWPSSFEQERDQLRASLSPAGGLVTIEHIGSTAVPGLAAKPIIDIMISVERLAIVNDRWIKPLASMSYEYVPDYEDQLPMRRYFRKPIGPDAERTHHLHIVESDSEFRRRHLCFRDRLRADATARQEYERLKRRLSLEHRFDREAYTDAKSDFVERLIERPDR